MVLVASLVEVVPQLLEVMQLLAAVALTLHQDIPQPLAAVLEIVQ
jgi:hypothetical protein